MLAVSLLRGVLLSVYVLYIIWPALALYHVARAARGIDNIGWTVSSLTRNHILQLLILAFAFTTFLQGVAGFGVPVAVAAPLLIGIGYPPVQSVAVALVGHAWSVSMGDMASSFQALRAVTGLPGHGLGLWVASLLAGCALLTALSVAHLHAGMSGLRRWPLPILLLGASVAAVQWLLARFDLWVVATFGAGMAGLALGLMLARIPRYRGPSRPAHLPPKPEEERVRRLP
ncbi:MAG: L-lactate permease, partial [Nitrospinota bacterium]